MAALAAIAIVVYFILQTLAFFHWKQAWKAVAVVPLWIFVTGMMVVSAVHFFNPDPGRSYPVRLLVVTGLGFGLLAIAQVLIIATRPKA